MLRVLFAALPLFSCGMLTWATMLRLAIVTRRTSDWILCGVATAVVITGLVLMPDDVETTQADVTVGLILLSALVFTAYFLYADIRHDKVRRMGPAGASPYATTVPQHRTGYGYPPAYPQVQPQAHPQPQAQPLPAVPPQPQQQPHPTPPPHTPQTPAPQPHNPRLDEVRAELDELSHLLRKDEGK
ncbi:hypothetical protein [Streptomyces sp. NPDC008121]|uniref:hypothetical protein n=1 Tax=Streptomyces sp. NPDC008121 TaxID=3364809 RepID=UPI0036EE03BF